MKKKYIITQKQLNQYIENKQAEKIFFNIIEDLHKNSKFLNENNLRNNVNETTINNYKRRGLINPLVETMLKKHGILSENH
jgi:hypothetical protein